MRILVVDDNERLLVGLARLLRGCGHDVTLARGVGEALSVARVRGFDGVLTDLQLGPERGSDLIRQLRAESLCGLVVLMTAAHDFCAPDDLSDVAVLHKPFTCEQLLEVFPETDRG